MDEDELSHAEQKIHVQRQTRRMLTWIDKKIDVLTERLNFENIFRK